MAFKIYCLYWCFNCVGVLANQSFIYEMFYCTMLFICSSGWVDCWLTPIVALSINYTYHPIPSVNKVDKYVAFESLSTPDAEEMLLIPLRLNPLHSVKQKPSSEEAEFDPTEMESDEISVELEVGPSEICVYGALLNNLWHIKVMSISEHICVRCFISGIL